MALVITPEIEARVRTLAEDKHVDPAQLHEDLLENALTYAETQPKKTLVQGSPEWEERLWSLGKEFRGATLSLEATSREVMYEDSAL